MLLADCYKKTEIKSSFLNSVDKRHDEADAVDHGDEVYWHVSSKSLKRLDSVFHSALTFLAC